ncbi:MAG: type IV pilus secretin PilQ [Gammaproteobacteria bacterium]|nr:MAG: type IV pilus secretin PilQ [Gammaproteobacteria bacterium]RLA02628.1 MAG: type IV pilus secretin PilQ [Gammaproteobacteria bacterium]
MKNKQLAVAYNKLLGSFFRYTLVMTSLISIFLMSLANANAADLQSIGYSSLPGDKAQIVLTFSEQIEAPNSFSIDDPARVVLDFAGVHNKLDKKTQEINIGMTRSVSTIEAGERTRLVVNLSQKSPYTIEQDGNVILLTIDGAAKQVAQGDATGMAVTDIDFRRGDSSEARLMIDLSGEGAAIDVHQEQGNIVVDLINVSLPENLHRRLDVIDFATPVQFIDSEQRGRNTRLTLSTKGDFEQLTYQSDKTLVVEVKPVLKQAQSSEAKDQFGYKGEKLSLNFQNIEVRAVLQLLADFTGLNLVTSDTVQGNVTLRLKNVPWDQALDIILKTKGLAMRQNGNILLVAPAVEIAAREKQELEAQKQLIELETLYSEIIEINFAKASELAVILDSDEASSTSGAGVTGFLSERGSVTVDVRTNSLLIRDTADQLVQIRRLIKKLDIPVRQVLIESRIVIASDDFAKELGVRFGSSALGHSNNSLYNTSATSGTLNGTTQLINGDTLEQADRLNVNLPVVNPAGTIALALAKLPFGGTLELELSAMQEEGRGEVVSSPRVITSNQQTATIQQGTEIPYQEASSSGATSVSFKEAVLKLEVTPQITPDDRIVMDLEVNKDEVGEIFLGVPSIDTRSVKTQVLVDNGETVVLGGIYERTENEGSTRVPFFGDLPYVGFLFKTNTNESRQRELLVFITPKIIKDSLKF